MILMCKNKEVFDVDNEIVIDSKLLPGIMINNPSKLSFIYWMEKRYSEKSNTFSRKLRGLVFGQGNRQKINEQTHALSLSDCYWIKRREENVAFEDVSPYFTRFWNGTGFYEGLAVPTLYVNGYLSKYWLDKNTLIKVKEKHEIYCSEIAKEIGLSVVNIKEHNDGIAVGNFTNENIMFEAADISGKISPEDFTSKDVLEIFGETGFDMLLFDAIVGNGDRHAGNFGFLRNSDTGEYLGMAPLFDFDHAFESNNVNDVLIKEIIDIKAGFIKRFDEIIKKLECLNLNEYLVKRLTALKGN